MDPQGKVWFGVYNNGCYTVNTASSLNDGQWHHVVGTMDTTGPDPLRRRQEDRPQRRHLDRQPYNGYWRIGGDSAVERQPVLQRDDRRRRHLPDLAPARPRCSSTTRPAAARSTCPTRPSDAYGGAIWDSSTRTCTGVSVRPRATAGTRRRTSSTGTYQGATPTASPARVDRYDQQGGRPSTAATGSWPPRPAVSNPTVYSEELWFKTTTNPGGKLIGFGSAAVRHQRRPTTGTSTCSTTAAALRRLDRLHQHHRHAHWPTTTATGTTWWPPRAPDGMKLYVDGALAGTNGQTARPGLRRLLAGGW